MRAHFFVGHPRRWHTQREPVSRLSIHQRQAQGMGHPPQCQVNTIKGEAQNW